jgi:hypothetical protein
MRLQDDLCAQRPRARDGRIEIAYLEPEQDAVPAWRRVSVNQIWVIVFIPGMELEDQFAVQKNAVVVVTMFMFGERVTTQQALIPRATRAYVAHGDQRLRLNPGAFGLLGARALWLSFS